MDKTRIRKIVIHELEKKIEQAEDGLSAALERETRNIIRDFNTFDEDFIQAQLDKFEDGAYKREVKELNRLKKLLAEKQQQVQPCVYITKMI